MSELYGRGMDIEGELTVNKDEFALRGGDDHLRVDGLCRKLLMRFFYDLLERGMLPQEATRLAGGADYYLRDFLTEIKERSLFDERGGVVRQFAGNWYIANTLEPNMTELEQHLQGIRALYGFLHRQSLISDQFLQEMEEECDDLAWYGERIQAFWDIQGDGYLRWERECSLKDE